MDAWCGLVRESSYPVMERLLLFSCRQSIHQLSLPNLALNEQHNPRVCATHTHNRFSLHFSHVTRAVYNVLPSQTVKPQTGDALLLKPAAEIRPGHFDYPSLVAGLVSPGEIYLKKGRGTHVIVQHGQSRIHSACN